MVAFNISLSFYLQCCYFVILMLFNDIFQYNILIESLFGFLFQYNVLIAFSSFNNKKLFLTYKLIIFIGIQIKI